MRGPCRVELLAYPGADVVEARPVGRGMSICNCRCCSFNATPPACTSCQYRSRSASRRPCSSGPATNSALFPRTASMVARPITSITSSMARWPFLSSLINGSSCSSFASQPANSRLLAVDVPETILYGFPLRLGYPLLARLLVLR